MKEADVTKLVMKKVVGLEKSRTRVWLGKFILVTGGLLLVAGVFIVIAAQDILSRDTLDLLTIFSEDREIIQEYWQDTMNIFFLELPIEKLLVIMVVVILLLMLLIFWRKNLAAAFKKYKLIREYK